MAPRAEEKGITLLYVEDEAITRETVLTLLGRRFPELTLLSACNGAQGLTLFEELAPDLVVTDIRMPVMGGIEMARCMLAKNRELPVIVTSAHSDVAYLTDSIEIGISRYVMKPVDSAKLFSAVEAALAALRMERAFKAQQEHIRKLSRAVEQSTSAIVITDTSGVIEYANPRFTQLTGYGPEEVSGRNLRDLQQAGEESWAAALAGFEWQGEVEGVRKDGGRYFEQLSLAPVFDENKRVSHLVAVKQDVTERLKSARKIEELNLSLAAHAAELEVANGDLERFSYTVSHDLRSPLTNINGYCQVIQELYGPALDEQCNRFVDIIYQETVGMGELIGTLLNFAKLSRLELATGEVDLSEMAGTVAATLRLREPERRARFLIAPGLAATGDPALLRVVLDNLFENAWKYTGGCEEAVIEFGATGNDKSEYFVRDNGAGFDMAQAGRLFAPFERLHGEHEFKGFGIGLATVQRIIQRHGGEIRAEGEVGKGATFLFTLPAKNRQT